MQTVENSFFNFFKAPSTELIESFDSKTVSLLREHKLSGYVYQNFKNILPPKITKIFHSDYLFQSFVNERMLDAYLAIEKECQDNNIKPARIKGVDLIYKLYDTLGERHLSDIDLYIDKENYNSLKNILNQKGFFKEIQTQFGASCFRGPYSKQLDEHTRLQLDVHTQLFWRQKENFNIEITSNSVASELTKEKHLFYLIVNWGYQDTFWGLSKLLDIYLFIKKYSDELNWELILEDVKICGLERLFLLTNHILSEQLGLDTPLKNIKKRGVLYSLSKLLLDKSFLLEPKKNKLKFYFLKHTVKPNLMVALEYDLIWIKAYKWKNLMRLFFSPAA